MHSENQQQQVKQVLQTEIEYAYTLLQSLEMEYQVLAKRQVDVLEELVTDKLEKIQQLESASRRRTDLLASFVSVEMLNENQQSPDDYQAYLLHGNEQLSALWDELVDVAEKCRDKNRVNGSIVELISKQSRQALEILHGIPADSTSVSDLYDYTGQTIKSVITRSIIQV